MKLQQKGRNTNISHYLSYHIALVVVTMSLLPIQMAFGQQTQTQTGVEDQIASLKQLPQKIYQQKINIQESTPEWIQNILSKAINSNNLDVISEALIQIGNLKLSNYENPLLALYESKIAAQDEMSVRLCPRIVAALGCIGGPSTVALLQSIIKQHELTSVNEEAIIASRRLCDISLSDEIALYVNDLEIKIGKGEYQSGKYKIKPAISPENTLLIAKGVIESINTGTCAGTH